MPSIGDHLILETLIQGRNINGTLTPKEFRTNIP